MTGVARARRGDARGEEKGETVEEIVLPKVEGTKPGGARGLTASLGEPDMGVGEPRQEAGEGRRKIVCLMGGGDADVPPPSRNRQRASSIALSREVPVRLVSLRKSSSSLSVLSSSSSVASCKIGKHISKCSSETMMSTCFIQCGSNGKESKLWTVCSEQVEAHNSGTGVSKLMWS